MNDNRPFDALAFERTRGVELVEELEQYGHLHAAESTRDSLIEAGYHFAEFMPREVLASGNSDWISRWLRENNDPKAIAEAEQAEDYPGEFSVTEPVDHSIGERERSGIEPSPAPYLAQIHSEAADDALEAGEPRLGRWILDESSGQWVQVSLPPTSMTAAKPGLLRRVSKMLFGVPCRG